MAGDRNEEVITTHSGLHDSLALRCFWHSCRIANIKPADGALSVDTDRKILIMGNSSDAASKENSTIIWSTEEAVQRYLAIDIVTGKDS